MSKETMKLALEALEYIHEGANNQGPHTGISWRCVAVKAEPAIKAIKQARALDKMAENARELGLDYEPAQQEPVAWRYRGILHEFDPSDWAEGPVTPLYTTPPAQPAPVQELERLRDENERLHVENRRLIDRIETMGVPVGVGGFLTTTNAAQRQWVGLTDEEISALDYSGTRIEFVRAIEAKLRSKNNE